MANEIQFAYKKGLTVYARIFKLDTASETGYVWDTSATDFVD